MDENRQARAVGDILKAETKTLAVAESCTGGGVGQAITSIPGSSDYFVGGIIAYSNEVKVKQLGLLEKMLEKYGAVSEEAATAMAKGVKKKFGTDYGVSATGIAGPGGGTKEKPVGLIYISVSGPNGDSCRRLLLTGNRQENRETTVLETLRFLLEQLTLEVSRL